LGLRATGPLRRLGVDDVGARGDHAGRDGPPRAVRCGCRDREPTKSESNRHPDAEIIIPPRATAVPNETTMTQRDRHITTIGKHGRMGWQRRSGYNRRSLVETAVYRYKTIIGRRLQARTLPTQRTEAKIGCNVLNRMTSIGMPASARIR
jgi:hypothetical protein